MTLTQLKQHNPEWFSRKNKRFFNDVSYRLLHSKATGEPYLVRSTYAWTDMFGSPKKLHYRVNPIEDNFEIGLLIDNIFPSIYAVKDWLKVSPGQKLISYTKSRLPLSTSQ